MVWGEQGSVLGRWFGLETVGEAVWVLAVNGLRYPVGIQNIKQSANNDYVSTKRSSVCIPVAGDVVYDATQHIGGIGSAIYGEDGRIICLSKPIYGKGNSVGDEAGYVVGMSTCYPKPRSVNIANGEMLTFDSTYSSEKMRTGVMALFQIFVTESYVVHEESKLPSFVCGVAVFVLAMYVAVMVSYRRRKQSEDDFSVTTRMVYFSDLR
ncbi:putative stress up-regulated Nod 19 [Tanacetum coccineum]